MKFVDEAKIQVIGGDGGSGIVHWRREKFVPKGGPDGGDGGCGGAVIFETDPGLNTLIDFSFISVLRAESGQNGGENQKSGRDGQDVVSRVPVGTQVFYEDRLVADLSAPGSRWIAARGGRGGRGNTFFKSATNQAPDYAQPGMKGENRVFTLILKSVADVGLVGLPNAGKSTLVGAISASKPKVADYPFTTIRPSLGVVLVDEERRFVIADIPGLIPGAHEGKGLGLDFLRHIERTSVLAHLIDGSALYEQLPDDEGAETSGALAQQRRKVVIAQYEAIERELELFSPSLIEKPRLVLISKADLSEARETYDLILGYFRAKGLEVQLISSHSGFGLAEFKDKIFKMVMHAKGIGKS